MTTGLDRFTVKVNDARITCDCSGAAYWHAEKLLVVADLHLEKSSCFARHGQLLPPYDSERTLKRLKTVVEKYQPQTIIALGDSFHDNQASLQLSEKNRQLLEDIITHHEMIWIAGNHDDEKTEFTGQWTHEIRIGSLLFRHEPLAGTQKGEIAGHLHPALRISRRGMSVRRFCFASDGNRMILPAFGAYAGGLDLSHKAFYNIFDKSALIACLLGKNTIYPIQKRSFFSQ
ncbi:ligase-associated DNA damage response endonuclease PdeM [Bartonella choladocola]|uniref:Phosphoesterase n=1 Tax=Bartonella choladocola TaxID=2750995 RepID=A0A1U9MFU6_9HYPH|nr:ligase-associated DNA damage response endonuclease PdeM [Bartonella choladocola]AQT46603.1 putative phosphoesterase [Bartonella choladocola]